MSFYSTSLLFFTFALISVSSLAQLVIQPSSGASNLNYDEITTSTGVKCRQAMGSNLNAEIGITATDNSVGGSTNELDLGLNLGQSGVYARVTYALGTPKRLDCSRLYEVEMETLRLQIKQLRNE